MVHRLACAGLALCATASALAQFSYDFESLSLGDILGQDGWFTIQGTPAESGSMIIQSDKVSPVGGSTKALLMQRVASQATPPDRRVGRSLGMTINSGTVRVRVDEMMGARVGATSNLTNRVILYETGNTNQIVQPFMQNGGGPGAAQNTFIKRDGIDDPVFGANNFISNATMFPDVWYRLEFDLDWATHTITNARIYDLSGGVVGLPYGLGAIREPFGPRGDPQVRYHFNSDIFNWFDQLGQIAFRYTNFAGDPGTEYAVMDNFKITPLVAVTGTVILQNHSMDSIQNERVIVEIKQNGNVLDRQVRTPDENGAFRIYTDLQGTFDISIKGSHWLQATVPGVVINGSGGSIGTVQQINGDVDGDNEVNLVDYGLVSAAFGTTGGEPPITPPDGGWNYQADLDRDNEVNLVDVGIVAANFGQAGDE